jgi:hypothetical protein
MARSVKHSDQVIDGRAIEVYVTDDGNFEAAFNSEEHWKKPSLKALLTAIRGYLRRQRANVKVEATLAKEVSKWNRHDDGTREFITTEPVLITGVHARNHNPLMRRADGSDEQWVSTYSDGHLLRRLTPAQCKKLEELDRDRRKLQRQYEKFLEDHKLDVSAALKAAWEQAGIKEGDDDGRPTA